MTTITFPYAVIYHGVFYPANAPIEVLEKVEETEETEEKVEQAKPRGRKKNDN